MTSPKNTILILGGSYAGLSTAHYLLRHVLPALPNKDSYQVVLVSASSQTLCRPACPRALLSDDFFPQDKLFVNTAQQLDHLPKDSWTFINGTATQVDHERRITTITLTSGDAQTIPFHTLVIATGSSTPSALLGLNTTSPALRSAWSSFRTALPIARHIVIAGGGPAGVEVAGELGEFLNGRPDWFGGVSSTSKTGGERVRITLITSAREILPALRPSIAHAAEAYLRSLGVSIVKETKVFSVEPEDAGCSVDALTSPVTLGLSSGETLDADLYIPATGARPNTAFLEPMLLDGSGRVATNPQTLRVEAADTPTALIYAIGDASSFARPAVHNIIAAIPILCSNIRRDLLLDAGVPESDVGAERDFQEDTRETQLVPIGTKKGVGAAMGWRVPSWAVWLIKGRDYWLWTTGKLWSGQQWAKEG